MTLLFCWDILLSRERCMHHHEGDPQLLWLILAFMKILPRLLFKLLFLFAALSGLIDSWTLSKVVPLAGARVQNRYLSGASPTVPALMESRNHSTERLLPEQFVRTRKEDFPCEILEITSSGAVCDGYRLNFPGVDLKEVLDGHGHLPRGSVHIFIPEKSDGAGVYRNIALDLRWEPATPEFLQIYLEEYLPYWGDRIPYRLLWSARYEVCPETCSSFSDAGEFLPEDIDDLSPSLAADVNFNGMPAAFWNVNVNP